MINVEGRMEMRGDEEKVIWELVWELYVWWILVMRISKERIFK